MSLHKTPEDHDADPPSAWLVVKAGERAWHLDSSLGGTFGYYKTRKAAQADRVSGFYVSEYEKDARWFRGEPVWPRKPYAQVAAGRGRNEAWGLGCRHGREGVAPFGDLADAGSADLMTALGETEPATEANYARREDLMAAYMRGWNKTAGRECAAAQV